MIFYVYMLKSVNNKITKTYVGYTNNLNLRLKKHNAGIGAKSTRGYKWEIIYKKIFYDKREAMSFEYKLKKDKKKRKYLLNYKKNFNVMGQINENFWNNKKTLQLIIKDIIM